ncbi:hypothetical protein CC2G_013458 [Coprinopsis cinerea AmutBmut pab1-1]|nr:hypothetical protein CC2G_013458 [Coprinopsis cinerea AmutBmut pab1-1]
MGEALVAMLKHIARDFNEIYDQRGLSMRLKQKILFYFEPEGLAFIHPVTSRADASDARKAIADGDFGSWMLENSHKILIQKKEFFWIDNPNPLTRKLPAKYGCKKVKYFFTTSYGVEFFIKDIIFFTHAAKRIQDMFF